MSLILKYLIIRLLVLLVSKYHCLPLVSKGNKLAMFPFELIHSNIWGPFPIVSKTGFKYFVTFIDDYSRLTCDFVIFNEKLF